MVTESGLHDRLRIASGRRSFKEIGHLTGTHPETVRRYMQGQFPGVEFVAAFCTQLGLNGEWLLTGRGAMKVEDVRAHALREANASELLTAIAATLERLIDRVERIEVFLQTLETRLRVRTQPEPVNSPHEPARALPLRAQPIGQALAERSCPDAGGDPDAGGI